MCVCWQLRVMCCVLATDGRVVYGQQLGVPLKEGVSVRW